MEKSPYRMEYCVAQRQFHFDFVKNSHHMPNTNGWFTLDEGMEPELVQRSFISFMELNVPEVVYGSADLVKKKWNEFRSMAHILIPALMKNS
jgi:hypothetical protein